MSNRPRVVFSGILPGMNAEHITLYRKYRPATFDEVVGQEHVVTALQGAAEQGTFAHAYLFSGTRGTGKTSLARIFARAIGTNDNDLYEIDAASNRGVDDVRALREEVTNMPFSSPYKVYIIDEVHMLTKEAFNALLKTLEEPPKHAVFILATTELHKLPDTIVSRCQTYRFATPSSAIIRDMLVNVAKKEGYTLDPASAEPIALLADGSFRDALGVLQKALAYSTDKVIDADEVRNALGVPKIATTLAFVDALACKDAPAALDRLSDATKSGANPQGFLLLVLRVVRAVLVTRAYGSVPESLAVELTEDERVYIERHAKDAERAVNSHLLRRLLGVYNEPSISYLPFVGLELAVVELCEKA